MTPSEAVSASTINAAHALQLAHRVGSIERGKDADLILLRVPDYREIPYHFGVNLVDMTLKQGRLVYKDAQIEWPFQ